MKYDIIIFGTNKINNLNNNRKINSSTLIIKELLKREDINKILFIDILPVKRLSAIRLLFSIIIKKFKPLKSRSFFGYCEEIQKNKLYHYSTILSVISWKLLYKNLEYIISKLSLKNLILWSHYPLNVDYFSYLEHKKSVIFLDKDWQKLKSLQQKSKINYMDVLRKNYNKISDKADYIFTTSDDLLEIFMGHNNSYWITDLNEKNISNFNWKKLVDEMFDIIKA